MTPTEYSIAAQSVELAQKLVSECVPSKANPEELGAAVNRLNTAEQLLSNLVLQATPAERQAVWIANAEIIGWKVEDHLKLKD